jgi:hypothetical protein
MNSYRKGSKQDFIQHKGSLERARETTAKQEMDDRLKRSITERSAALIGGEDILPGEVCT